MNQADSRPVETPRTGSGSEAGCGMLAWLSGGYERYTAW